MADDLTAPAVLRLHAALRKHGIKLEVVASVLGALTADPDHRRLAARAGHNPKSVTRAVRALHELGLAPPKQTPEERVLAALPGAVADVAKACGYTPRGTRRILSVLHGDGLARHTDDPVAVWCRA